MLCYYLTFTAAGRQLSAADEEGLARFLQSTPGMTRALIFTPAHAHDPYLDDGVPPPLMLECYFPTVEGLEAAIADDGHFGALAGPDLLPSLAGSNVTQQAMLARFFPVPSEALPSAPLARTCTYVVSYRGEAEDANLWLSYYIAHHPKIMARFPGIREIEISTRIDWCSGLPWNREDDLQRNKTAFDNQEALNTALNSPVRHEMREDFKRFPPFAGKNIHYAMMTRSIAGRSE